jgi:glycosyltransferase involved in cell wall biosynthesis
MDCSAIISASNEWPKVAFTVQSIMCELDDYCDYEIIVVDNLSTDQTERHFTNIREPKIKYIQYKDKQSHWCAKNAGIKAAKGKNLFFIDAHCIIGRDALRNQIEFLENFKGNIGGVHCLHNTITMRKPYEYELKTGKFSYRFMTSQTLWNHKIDPYEVGVMTTCGMMCKADIFKELGGWNPEFGVRVGGEAYMNFKHSTCGYPHYIHPKSQYFHMKTDYKYPRRYNDVIRNYFIAAYTTGGLEWLDSTSAQYEHKIAKGKRQAIYQDVIAKCTPDMEFIKSKQKMSLTDYFKRWKF